MLQKPDLGVEAAGETCQAAVRSDDPMTGNQDGDRVMADRTTNCPGGRVTAACPGQLQGDVPVGHRLAIGDLKQDGPDGLPECGPAQGQRHLHGVRALAREVAVKPLDCLVEDLKIPLVTVLLRQRPAVVPLSVNPDTGQGPAVA